MAQCLGCGRGRCRGGVCGRSRDRGHCRSHRPRMETKLDRYRTQNEPLDMPDIPPLFQPLHKRAFFPPFKFWKKLRESVFCYISNIKMTSRFLKTLINRGMWPNFNLESCHLENQFRIKKVFKAMLTFQNGRCQLNKWYEIRPQHVLLFNMHWNVWGQQMKDAVENVFNM